MSMSKVTETRTQDDLREAITPLNLSNYLHDLEQHAKQTGHAARGPEDQLRAQQEVSSMVL